MLATAVFTGMRRGEIIALMWENVDLSNNIIKVKYSEYKAKLTTPKSKASCRNITISTVLKKILIEQKT
jgi:integrase